MRYAVRRTNIIGTRNQVYSAWAPRCGHSTIMSIDGEPGWFGRVGTEELPREIDALPALSDERSKAYSEWRDGTYKLAYWLIGQAFLCPDGIDGAYGFSMGECEHRSGQTGTEIRWVDA